MTIKGIDVSSRQPTFDTDGVAFVIIKATEGRSYINPHQVTQANAARAAGAVVGFYHFLWPGHIAEQARYFVEKCASIPGDLLAGDWENTSGGAATCAEKDRFLAEVKRLRGNAHRVILYCNRDFWLNRDTTSNAGDGLWIAQYNGKPGHPNIKAPWKFHQYTNTPIDTSVGNFTDKAVLRTWASIATSSGTTPKTASA